jgi:hypothetical protein
MIHEVQSGIKPSHNAETSFSLCGWYAVLVGVLAGGFNQSLCGSNLGDLHLCPPADVC